MCGQLLSTDNPQNSPTLFTLPSEIRNRIYELALNELHPVPIREPEPGMLHVCQQARREALPVYYGQNKFVFISHQRTNQRERDPDNDDDLRQKLATLGTEAIPHIRNLRLVWSVGFVDMSPRSTWPGILDVDVSFSEDRNDILVAEGGLFGWPCFDGKERDYIVKAVRAHCTSLSASGVRRWTADGIIDLLEFFAMWCRSNCNRRV